MLSISFEISHFKVDVYSSTLCSTAGGSALVEQYECTTVSVVKGMRRLVGTLCSKHEIEPVEL